MPRSRRKQITAGSLAFVLLAAGVAARLLLFTASASNAPVVTNISPNYGPLAGGQTVTLTGSGYFKNLQFSQVAAGSSHACGVVSGEVYCWGNNTNGQLGNGNLSVTYSSTPIPVVTAGTPMDGKTITAVATGSYHTVALASDGTVYAWGYNNSGQLGNNSTVQSALPVAVYTAGVLSGKTISKISASTYQTVALASDGTVYAWGVNSNGQLGNNSNVQSTVPVAVYTSGVLSGKTITAIAAGGYHTVALASDGTVYAWGYNGYGGLGNNSTTQSTVPVAVYTAGVLSGKTIKAIAAGDYNSLALGSDGTVYAWGYNNVGQLGNNSTTQSTVPVAVYTAGVLSGKTINSIAASASTGLAEDTNGALYAWGANSGGQLGNNSTTQSTTPVAVVMTGVLSGETITGLAEGGNFSLALASDGTVYSWGSNNYGQLGNNSTSQSTTPVATILTAPIAFNLQLGGNRAVPTSQTATSLSFKTPAHAAGQVDLTMTAIGIDPLSLSSAYEYVGSPTANAVTPSSGYNTGGNTAVITGTGFKPDAKVYFGSLLATAAIDSSSQITATTPTSNYVGSVSIRVVNGDGQTATVAYTYTNPAPTVSAVTPSTGPLAGGQTVTLTGGGFMQGLSFKQVANGDTFGCGLTYTNQIYCWGNNTYGQLGNGTTNASATPTPITVAGTPLAGKTITAITAYTSSAAALASDGTVYAWGLNSNGQLGDSSTTTRLVPVAVNTSGVLSGKTIKAISMGSNFMVALSVDGNLYAWGYNGNGQLGNNSTTQSTSPVAVVMTGVLSGKTIVALSTGVGHTIALASDGTMYSWGLNANGQLGDTSITNRSVPVAVVAGQLSYRTVTAIVAGGYHNLALASDGTVYAWGQNNNGQLGNNSTTQNNAPVAVNTAGVLAGKTVTAIAAGGYHSAALTADGGLYTWGMNNYGELGNNSTSQSNVPVAVSVAGALSGKTITALSAGLYHTAVIGSDGTAYTWGSNTSGQLGVLAATSSIPLAVQNTSAIPYTLTVDGTAATITGQTATSLSFRTPAHAAGQVTLALSATNVDSASWPNSYAYIPGPTLTGVAPSSANNSGGDTVTLTGSNFLSGAQVKFGLNNYVAATYVNSTTLTANVPASYQYGSVAVTVSNPDGQVSTLASAFTYIQPAPTVSSLSPNIGPLAGGSSVTLSGSGYYYGLQFSQISASATGNFVCGISGGAVYCWGNNANGQLGNNSTTSSSIPVAVITAGTPMAGKTITNVAVGSGHALALASDGTLYAWGYNTYGQLGNNSTSQSNVPVAVVMTGVLSGKTVTAIAASLYHNAVLTSDGKVYTWGYNPYGELGNNSTGQSNAPVAVYTAGVLSGKTIKSIAAGGYHTVALASDGTAYDWGYNVNGQLGNGSTTQSSVPVPVSTSGVLSGKTLTAVSAGYYHTLALASDGTVYAWGNDGNGQLGNNSLSTIQSTPIAVTNLGTALYGKVATAISAGNDHSLALTSDGGLYAWGGDDVGQLGDGLTSNVLLPYQVNLGGTALAGQGISSINAGYNTTLVLAANGSLYGWGFNTTGQLGNNTTVNQNSLATTVNRLPLPLTVTFDGNPANVLSQTETSVTVATPAHAAGAVDVVVGSSLTASLTLSSGYTYLNAPQLNSVTPNAGGVSGGDTITLIGSYFRPASQVWIDDAQAATTYVDANTLTAIVPAAITSGPANVTVVNDDSQVAVIYAGYSYQTTAPTIKTVSPTYGPITGNTTVTLSGTGLTAEPHFKQVVSGNNFACGLTSAGTVYCWGGNTNGQLGNGSYTQSNIPVAVNTSGALAGKTITSIAAGASHVVALASDGTIFAWGYNVNGQLGNSSTGQSNVPVAVYMTGVLSGKTIKAVSAGAQHTLALASDGTVYAWGYGAKGQLGNNSTTTLNSPVAVNTSGVLAGKTITAISAGGYHNVALGSDGTVYAWGSNTNGQLGNNSTTQSSAPVIVTMSGVLAGKTITAVAGGGTHTLALASDGTVYSWGLNTNGQLGNNSTAESHVPVAVVTAGTPMAGKTITAINGGNYDSAAIDNNGVAYTWGLNTNGQLGNNSTVQSLVPVQLGTKMSVSQVSLNNNSACDLGVDTNIYCWGSNVNGQLGDNSTNDHLVPASIDRTGLASEPLVQSLTIGGQAAAVLNGTATTLQFVTPAHAAGAVDITLSGSGFGSVTASGAYQYLAPPTISSVSPSVGNLAGGDTITLTGSDFRAASQVWFNDSPATVTYVNANTLTVTSPVAIGAGAANIKVLNDDGQSSVSYAAYNYIVSSPVLTGLSPQVGPLTGGQTVTLSGNGLAAGVRFKQVAASVANGFGCGLSEAGKVYCWGYNGYGNLGNNSTTQSNVPVAVVTAGTPMDGKTITAIAAGGYHTVALASDGTVYAWGYNNYGELGNNSTTSSSTPVAVTMTGVLAGKTVTAISAGTYHTVALTSDGKVYTWGYGPNGQLGNNSTAQSNVPVAVYTAGVLSGKTITAISAGGSTSAALASDGTVYSWGLNSSGQLGNNSTTQSQVPVAVYTAGVLSGKTMTAVAVGGVDTMALASDGTVYTWGAGNNGQLGNNSTSQSNIPVAVVTAGTPMNGKVITSVSADGVFMLAVDSNGAAYSWGHNQYGELGNGTNLTISPYLQLTAGSLATNLSFTSVSAGSLFACGLASDANIYCWGHNSTGQLGDNTTTDHYAPASISRSGIPVEPVASAVLLGGNSVTPTNYTANSLQFVTPAHAAGQVDASMTVAGTGTVTLANAYQYISPPTVLSISPTSGSTAGGDVVTITGTGFTSKTTVKFGSLAAVNVTFVNSTTLVVTSPGVAGPGVTDISVIDEYSQINTLSGAYTYRLAAPTLTSVSPSLSKMAGGGTVTINGSGFLNKTDGGSWYTVSFGSVAATNVTYVSSTQLTATIPAHDPALVNLSVGGTYSDTATLSNAFTYLPAAYAFTNAAVNVAATEPAQLTVQALDGNGQPIASLTDTTLHLSSNSTSSYFATSLNGANTSWNVDSVVLPAGSSSISFYFKDNSQGTPNVTVADDLSTSVTQQETVGPRYKLLVTGVTNPTNAGVPSSVTVQSVDYSGVPQSDYTGTIHFSSTDGAASLPANYTFSTSDRGAHTFTNGVTMHTQGTWTVTATDTINASVTGAQTGIVVGPAVSGTISQLKFITSEQSFGIDTTSGVITVQTQDVNGLPVAPASATTIYLRTSSTTGQFALSGSSTWQGGPVAFTIPAGSTAINLIYRDTSAGTYQLKASQYADNDFGWSVATQNITVGVGAPVKLAISAANSQPAGVWSPVTVTLEDNSGNPVSSDRDVPVNLSSDTVSALFSASATGQSAGAGLATVIPAGQQSVTVYLQSSNASSVTVSVVDASTPVNGETPYTSAAKTITITAGQAYSLALGNVSGTQRVHQPVADSVFLEDIYGNIAVAASDTTVVMTSDNSSSYFGPQSTGPWTTTGAVTIPAGSTGANFYFRQDTVTDAVTLTAASVNLQSATQVLSVIAGLYDGKLQFVSPPATVTAGTPQTFTVGLFDDYGNPTVSTGDVSVGLGGTSTTTGVYIINSTQKTVTNPQTPSDSASFITIPAGSSTATVQYMDTLAGNTSLTAWDAAAWVAHQHTSSTYPYSLYYTYTNASTISQAVVVSPAAPASYKFTTLSQQIVYNTASAPITVTLYDQYNNQAYATSAFAANLSSTSTSGSFSLDSSSWAATTSLPFGQGASQAQVYYRDSQPGQYSLTVSGHSLTAATQTMTVIEGVVSQVVLDTAGKTSAQAGEIVPVVLSTQTAAGQAVPVLADTSFTLSSTANGQFSLAADPFTPVSQVSLSAGQRQVTLYWRASQLGTKQLTATPVGQTWTAGHTSLVVEAGAFHSLIFTSAPTYVEATKASGAFQATAEDIYGNVTIPDANQATAINLSSTSASAQFATSTSGPWGSGPVFIPAGASTTTNFYYRDGTIGSNGALTDTSILGNTSLTATVNGDPAILAATANFQLVGLIASNMVFTSQPQSLTAGTVSQKVTVQLQLSDGTPAVQTSDLTVSLAAIQNGGSGSFVGQYGNDVFSLTPTGSAVTSVTVPAGSSVAEFYVTATTAQAHRLRVGATILNHSGAIYANLSVLQSVSVMAAAPSQLRVDSAQQTILVSSTSDAIKVTLADQFGNPTTNATPLTVHLSSTCATGQFLDGPSGNPVSSLSVPVGQQNFFAYYSDSTAGSCNLTFAADDLTSASQTITVREPVFGLKIASSSQTVKAGQTSSPVLVQTQDRYGNIVTAQSPITVKLSSDNPNVSFSTSSLTIATGASSASATFRYGAAVTTNTTVNVGASDAANTLVGDQQANTVTPAPASQLVWSRTNISAVAGVYTPLSVGYQSQYNLSTTMSTPQTISLTRTNGNGAFYANVGDTTPITNVTIPAQASSSPTIYYRQTTADTGSLTAALSGLASGQASVSINAVQLCFSTGDFSVQTSAFKATTIKLCSGGTLPSDVVASLTTDAGSNGGFYATADTSQPITSATISAGQTESATIYYRQLTVTGRYPSTLTATPITKPVAMTSATAAVSVYNGALSRFVFIAPSPSSRQQNQPGTYYVQAQDNLGNAVTIGSNVCLYLRSDSATAVLIGQPSSYYGCVDTNGATAVLLLVGSTTTSFTYKDMTVGNHTLTISNQVTTTGGLQANQTVAITPAVTTKVVFEPTSYALVRGDVLSNMAVVLKSQYDVETAATSDTTVSLSSASATAAFQLGGNWAAAPTLTIPAGRSRQVVSYRDDNAALGTTVVTATSNGLTAGTANVSVVTGALAGLNFISDPQTLQAQQAGTFTVRSVDSFGNETPVTSNVCLYVKSSDSGATITGLPSGNCQNVTVNGVTTVALMLTAGQSRASFTYSSTNAGTASLTVSTVADGSGGLSANQNVTIVSGDPVALEFVPNYYTLERGGVVDTMAVVLRNAYGAEVTATSPVTINLTTDASTGSFSTSNTGPWQASQSLTIPAGQSRIGTDQLPVFYTDSGQAGSATLTAAATGLTAGTATVNVVNGDPAQVGFLTAAQSFSANHPSGQITIQLLNSYGQPTTTPNDLKLYLRSDSNGGEFALSPTTAWGLSYITVPAGEGTYSFVYRDSNVGTPTITVRDQLTTPPNVVPITGSQQETIEAQTFDHFIVTNVSTPQTAGTPSSVVVLAVDSANYVVPGYAGTISFSSDDSGAVLPTTKYTFVPGTDKGIHTFTNAVAFRTAGTKTVIVNDSSGNSGAQYNIQVQSPNTAPVQKLVFIEPASQPYSTAKDSISTLTVQLQDATQTITTAPSGGFPIHLTDTSTTGQFALSPDGPWSQDLVANVGQGLSYVNVYFRDSTGGSSTVTASDWLANVDNAQIANASLAVTIDQLQVSSNYSLMVRDYTGKYVANRFLFASNDSGSIDGYVVYQATARSLLNQAPATVNWLLDHKDHAGNLLHEYTYGNQTEISYQSDPITAQPGADQSLSIQVTSGSLTALDNLSIPVSPWTVQAQVAQSDQANTVTANVNANLAPGSNSDPNLTAQIVKIDGTPVTEAVIKNVGSNTGSYAFNLSTAGLAAGVYRILTSMLELDGSILAQDLSPEFTVAAVDTGSGPTTVPEVPTNPSSTNPTETPQAPIVTPPASTGNGTGNTGTSRPTKPSSSGTSESAVSKAVAAIQAGVKAALESPATPVAVPTSLFGVIIVIAVVLIYQAYKEWRQARWLIAQIKRDQALVADKDNFLQLAAHYLRTPLTIIRSSVELLASLPAAAADTVKAGLQAVADNLRNRVEQILAETSESQTLQAVTAEDPKAARRRLLRSPIFWLPVTLSIVLTVLCNWAITTYGHQTVNARLLIQQGLFILAGLIVLYTAVRALAMRQERRRRLDESRAKTMVLSQAKTAFAERTYGQLKDVVAQLPTDPAQTINNEFVVKSLKEGTSRLRQLVDRFAMMAQVDNLPLNPAQFTIQSMIDQALAELAIPVTANHVALDKQVAQLALSQDNYLLTKVIETIIDTAATSAAEVTVKAQTVAGMTELHVTAPATAIGVPAEDLFSVYTAAADEAAGTSSADNVSNLHRLDLYLDRLIMNRLGGSIVAQAVGDSIEFILKLPNLAPVPVRA